MMNNIEGEISEREAQQRVGQSDSILKREPLRGGGHFMGLKIYENDNLTVPIRTPRTWRERLFERPWRPTEQFNYSLVPDPQLYSMGLGVVGHSSTIEVMKVELADSQGRLGLAEVLGRLWWPGVPAEFMPAGETESSA
jgi:hypothetical protein